MDSAGITKTTISVSGLTPLVNFSSLSLNERMLDVNSFSFSWLADDVKATFSDITAFKNKNLSQLVTITFLDENANPNHSFRGFITQINSSITDDIHTSFQITGLGVFCTLTEKTDCKSFSGGMAISTVLEEVNPGGTTTTIKTQIQDDESHDYIVQYNQTAFDFIKMLAIRYGHWMYYDGKVLQFGDKPATDPIVLEAANHLDNISIYASTGKANANVSAFDMLTGKPTTSTEVHGAPGGSDLLKLTDDASGNVYKNKGNGMYMPVSQDQKKLDKKNKLSQQGTTSGNVFICAASHNSELSVGAVIAITDEKNKAGQKFIIIEISHSANNDHGYSNNFTAVPFEAAVPNYTNPHYYPRATIQPAIIIDNEDKEGEGLDRVKVRFPWMSKQESTPWIPVIIPYAGKLKGFKWLPEIDEEVMIDFVDNNVQRPIMIGAFRTEKGKSGMPYQKNTSKYLCSKDGRGLRIVDDKGYVLLKDNFDDNFPSNQMGLVREQDLSLFINSRENKDNGTVITMGGKKGDINIFIMEGSQETHKITLDKDSKSITIKSNGKIIIEADEEISLKSKSIKINASQQLSLSGGGVNIEGQQVKVKANTKLEMEATAEAKLKSAKIEIKADAMASLESTAVLMVKGMPVMIN